MDVKEIQILDYSRDSVGVIEIGNWDSNGSGSRYAYFEEIEYAPQGYIFRDDYSPSSFDMGWETLKIIAKGDNYALCEKEIRQEISHSGQPVADEVRRDYDYYLIKW